MSGRAVPEWIGSSPDAKVPPRVRLRIFDAHDGKCHISGLKILGGQPWELEHITALANGGEHRESNLAPALKDKHKAKTARDVAEKSAVATTRKKHLGITGSRWPMPGGKKSKWKKKIGGGVVPRDMEA